MLQKLPRHWVDIRRDWRGLKVIAVDLYEVTPASVASLAALALSLGVTYWLVNERRPETDVPDAPSGDA